MALVEVTPVSFYLPPLDKCLHEDHRLISFKQAYNALADLSLAKRSENLQHFLRDDQTISLLSSDLNPYPTPSSQTKSDFETRTAAINVTPSQDGCFNIEQIKEDTLWLSKIVNIDEVSALRFVVLEWQDRAAARLLEGYTEEEAISLQQAVGNSAFGASQLSLSTFAPRSEDDPRDSFVNEALRRSRQLRVYLEERQYLLGLSCLLAAAGLPKSPLEDDPAQKEQASETVNDLPWLHSIVESLSTSSQGKQKPSNPQRRLKAAIDELEKALRGWENGAEWLAEIQDTDEAMLLLDSLFRTVELTRVCLILKLVCIHISGLQMWATAADVQAWFEFVDRIGFFEPLQAQVPDQQILVGPIQALTSVITLQLLRLPQAIGHITEAQPHGRPIPYIYDERCRQQVDATLSSAGSRASRIASPALFAWSLILQSLRERVQTSDPASDEEASEDTPPPVRRQTSRTARTGFTTALDAILHDRPNEDPIDGYARVASDVCGLLPILSTLSQVVESVLTISWLPSPAIHAAVTLFDLLRQSVLVLAYSDDLLSTFLTILEDDLTGSSRESPVKNALARYFVRDRDILLPQLLSAAAARYPAELTALLKLCAALAMPEDALHKSNVILTEPNAYFTSYLPQGFEGYETAREEENMNIIRLKEDIPLFLPRRSFGFSKQSTSQAIALRDDADAPLMLRIPAGTLGEVIQDTKPFLVRWDHDHSVPQYLACLLASETPGSRHRVAAGDGVVSIDVQADIIGLFAKLVAAHAQAGESHEQAKHFLEETSESLGRNEDIVSVIFEIFDEHLSIRAKASEVATDLLVSCLDFMRAVLPVLPGRIWPILAKGQLLGLDADSNKLAVAVASAETLPTRISLVTRCVELTDALARSVITQAGLTSDTDRSHNKRFEAFDDRSSGLPSHLTGNVLHSSVQTLLAILESTQSWPVEASEPANNVQFAITRTLDYIVLRGCACSEGGTTQTRGLSAGLVPAAKLILTAFLSPSTGDVLTSRLLSALAKDKPTTRGLSNTQAQVNDDRVVIVFLRHILDYSKVCDMPALQFQQRLFESLPLLSRLYTTNGTLQSPILLLLSTLVRRAGESAEEPPSLLGHLGGETAKAYLTVLKQFSRTLGDAKLELDVWKLATSAIDNNQQWFTTVLISGEPPKRGVRNGQPAAGNCERLKRKDRSFLAIAIDEALSSPTLEDARSLHILRFIAQAQNHRPWVANTIRQNGRFIARLLEYVASIRTSLSRDELQQAHQNSTAAAIADVLAVYTHSMRQFNITDQIDDIASKTVFYRENGVAMPEYNSSLHSNLKRNFEKRYQGISLDSFKRGTRSEDFGRSYFYDISFATEVLGQHSSWHGRRGFEEEYARANLNLSLVESQILLMNSWESLAVELSQHLAGREGLQKQMINTVYHCFSNNIKSSSAAYTEQFLDRLLQRRIDLALVILQRLVNVRCTISTFRTLLGNAWDVLRVSGQDFELAFTGSSTGYLRTCLQALLLTLQPHTYKSSEATPGDGRRASEAGTVAQSDLPLFLEIVSTAICPSFRSLCAQLHSKRQSVAPSDLALLVGLVQTILRIPSMSSNYNTLALRLTDSGIHRYAIALFSWCERLMTVDGGMSSPAPHLMTRHRKQLDGPSSNVENVLQALTIADLTATFLSTLSSIPPLAEFLATDSTLSQLASVPLLSYLNTSDTSSSTELQRLQLIWSRSILPLVLNLLTSVGSPFAPEAVAFLSAFPGQLKRASSASSLSTSSGGGTRKSAQVDPLAGAITLATACEVHVLALIWLAIEEALASPIGLSGAIGEGGMGMPQAFNAGQLKEDLTAWVGPVTAESSENSGGRGRRGELRQKIAPTSEAEEALMARAPGANGKTWGCENALEERIVGEIRGALMALGG